MAVRYKLGVVLAAFFPNKARNEILRPEYLVTKQSEIGNFLIIDADQNDAITPQKRLRCLKAGQDHVQPVSMEAPGTLSVGRRLLPLAVDLPGQREIIFDAIAKIIRVNEILARVVWRVDVDELHLSRVTLS